MFFVIDFRVVIVEIVGLVVGGVVVVIVIMGFGGMVIVSIGEIVGVGLVIVGVEVIFVGVGEARFGSMLVLYLVLCGRYGFW